MSGPAAEYMSESATGEGKNEDGRRVGEAETLGFPETGYALRPAPNEMT
jgi:hypothetical protein